MRARPAPRPPAPPSATPSARMLRWWFGLTGLGGLAFGLTASQRPFGDALLAHPLIVFGVASGAGLLILRIITRRPVPELLPERILLAGFALGIALFVGGDFLVGFLARH